MNDDATTFSTVMDMVMHAASSRARQEERAAVVAWLRKEAVSHRRDGFPIAAYTMQERADAIERGEHRREEGA